MTRLFPRAVATGAMALVLVSTGVASATILHLQAFGANGSAAPAGIEQTECGPFEATTFAADAQLPAGSFSNLAGQMDIALSFATDGPGASLVPGSSVTFSNARGSVRLLLSAGSCPGALASGGGSVAGSGSWSLDEGASLGSYREATGSGTFDLTAGTAGGGGNPWSIAFDGDLVVLQPNLLVEAAESTWRHQAGDPPGRVATVTFRITNQGPGDAFDLAFLDPVAPEGFQLLSVDSAGLADLPAGDSADVTVRWSVRGLQGRSFDAALDVLHTDALGVAPSGDRAVLVVMPTRA